MRCFLLCYALFFCLIDALAVDWLFKDGRTDYMIVVADDASASELSAANELQLYLEKISGAHFPLVISGTVNGGKNIYVGAQKGLFKEWMLSIPPDTAETFTFLTRGEDLLIYGGRNMGTAYGVFFFLEQFLGVRWYSADCTVVPRRQRYILRQLNHTESPTFRFRHVLYYQMQQNPLLDIHNLLNMHVGVAPLEGYRSLDSFWGIHTFSLLLPPEEYFAVHPEYYSLRNGRRISDGQMCLSNHEVVEMLSKRMIQCVKENPGYLAYSLSQNDNQLFCECSACRRIADKYHSQAGLLLWAVNQVAEAVEKACPGICLVTFAYQYTRKAPKGICPRSNVFVRLCDIECCLLHPIEGFPENESFLHDLSDWHELGTRLHVFDYVTGFCQYIAPFPNFNVMARNLQTFHKYGVEGIMEEGQYESNGGEFAELKQWLLAKLLWNPNQDVQALARQFISDYYGGASSEVQAYFDLCCHLVDDSTHARFDASHDNSLYSGGFVEDGIRLLEKALQNCEGDSVVTHRVEHLLAQVCYLRTRQHPEESESDGTTLWLQHLIQSDGIFLREGQRP